jgi:DNA-binding SARP family transcriptional activator/thioredoxin-like negative regulator of GroEL/TolB-like protein
MELLREDGSSVLSVLAQPKRAALLAYLALAEPRGFHRRDKLKALFWPESDAEHARGSLNKAVHFLRGSLGEEAVVNRGVAELGLDWEQVWCGCRAFSTAVSEENWEQALELYRGELLEGFHLSGCPKFQGWLDEERERYRELAAKAAWSRSHQYLEAGEPGDAEQMAQRALGLLYTDESEVRRFITALAHVGDRAAAVRFYGKFEEKLWDELDLEPSAETQATLAGIKDTGIVGSGSAIGNAERPSTGPSPGEPGATPRDERSRPGTSGESLVPLRADVGIAETPPQGSGAPGQRQTPMKTWLTSPPGVLVISAAGLLGIVVALTFLRPRVSEGTLTENLVAVFPFENTTGIPELDGLGSRAARRITQGLGRIIEARAVSASTVRLRLFGNGGGNRVRRVASSLNAGLAVTGVVAPLRGDSLELSAELIQVASGEILFSVQAQGLDANLEPVLDELRDRTMGAVAVSLSWTRARYPHRPPTYDAYLAMELAGDEFNSGDMAHAIVHFSEAYALDTTLIEALWWEYFARKNRGDPGRDSVLDMLKLRRDLMTPLGLTYLSWQTATDWGAVARALRARHELDPESVRSAFDLAGALHPLGRFEEARQILSQVDRESQRARSSRTFWTRFASANLNTGHYEEALEIARRGRQLFPGRHFQTHVLQELYALAGLGRLDEMKPILNELQHGTGGQISSDFLQVSGRLAFFGHPQEARAVAQRAVDWQTTWMEDPNDQVMADALIQAGRPEEAVPLLRSLLDEDPRTPRLMGRLGLAVAQTADLEEAEDVVRELEAMENDSVATFWRVVILGHLDRKEEATSLLSLALLDRSFDALDYSHVYGSIHRFGPLLDFGPFRQVIAPTG